MTVSHHAITFTKLIKLVFNIVICGLYRYGDGGYFLGGSYNKNRDTEGLAAGVFIGFLIYNVVSVVSIIINRKSQDATITDSLMNFVGTILWVITGGVVMQFWFRFEPANHFISHNPKAAGIAMGALAVINSAVYLGETILTYQRYVAESKGY